MELAEFRTQPSQNVLQRMEEVLKSADNGYWWKADIWKWDECPIPGAKKGGYIYFNQPILNSLKTEIKFAIYQKIIIQDWSIKTVFAQHQVFTRIVACLSQTKNQHKSLLEKDYSYWKTIFNTYLTEIGVKIRGKYKYTNKQGETNWHDTYTRYSTYLYRIYLVIEETYDTREEWDKDLWNIEKLGLYYAKSKNLNFSKIKQLKLKITLKQYLKQGLISRRIKPSTAYATVDAVNKFSQYIFERSPNKEIEKTNRAIFENFLYWLHQELPNEESRINYISRLNAFFVWGELHQCLSFKERLIFPEDYPKRSERKNFDNKVIPDSVINQLCKYLDELPDYKQKMFILLANSGLRINELCHLTFDCLKSVSNGKYNLQFYDSKLDRYHSKPFAEITHKTEDIINLIKDQQRIVKSKFGDECIYLFPSLRSKPGRIKKVAASTLGEALKEIAVKHKIKDENGKYWHFHAHQFRHTGISKLANDDNIGVFGAKAWSGHKSIDMTLRYSHLSEHKLQKKIEKFNENNQVIDYTGKTIKLDQDERFKEYWNYIKEGNLLKAQTMEHGICTLPAMLSPCPHKHKCLSCTHFVTTPEYLPFHTNEYKVQLARKKVAEVRGQKRVIEDYNHTLEQLEKIIAKCGGDLEIIKASIDNQESTAELNLAQIRQLITKMGLSSIEELKQVIESIEES
jgi:integrase